MSKNVKIGIFAVCALLVLLISFGVYWYFQQYPTISINRVVSDREDDYHMEWLSMVISDNPNIPIAKNVQNKINEYSEWNTSTTDELLKYSAPLDVRVSTDVKDGKTVFSYQGYVTNENGETIDYKSEKTIDYVFDNVD